MKVKIRAGVDVNVSVDSLLFRPTRLLIKFATVAVSSPVFSNFQF